MSLQTQCTDALDNHLSVNFLFLLLMNSIHLCLIGVVAGISDNLKTCRVKPKPYKWLDMRGKRYKNGFLSFE